MTAILRLNMTLPGLDPPALSERYRAALDMAEVADAAGFFAISIDEHHGAPDGWLPSPLVFAGMLAARTTRVFLNLQALLLPLHDPLRVAEDLIVTDLVSGGRLAVTVGLGYRPEEYAAHRKSWTDRGALMDQALRDVVQAWRGEPVDRDGEQVHVTPRPLSPRPPLMVGGSSRPAARRAARFGLPLAPPAKLPDLETYYREQCAEHGTKPVVVSPPQHVSLVMVADDPDRSWAAVGTHLLHEATVYAGWQTPGLHSSVHSHATTVDELRGEGIYEILTPDECRARLHSAPASPLVLHPLCGGMPLDAAWECVHLFVDRVLKRPAGS
jgi:alkanesulfonate monooxygenase SsuD/methylene tetrahydromethanopterin reductase-like flavin-dependent oxidoreductase (luciferase family)